MNSNAHDRSADDELEHIFPGSSLVHCLTVTTGNLLTVSIEALEAIRNSGGGLDALHLVRRDQALDHRLMLVGLRPREARVLADRLAALPGVDHVSVEHRLMRR